MNPAARRRRLTIGLTGGIGSGKSTVAQIFAQRGAPVIDADVVARQVVAPGSQGLQDLVAEFGREILNMDGSLDRARLRHIAFQDAKSRERLEALLHPRIWDEMRRQAASASDEAAYVILVIPLLIESGHTERVDRILVVDCPQEHQTRRAMARDHASAEEIQAIMAAQVSRQQRLEAADDIIDNSGDIDALTSQVNRLHRAYLCLGRGDPAHDIGHNTGMDNGTDMGK